MKTLITLFDYSGIGAEPYEESGWQCLNIDLGLSDMNDMFGEINPIHYTDIITINYEWCVDNLFDNDCDVHGIIAYPPCVRFAQSGSQWWKKADESGDTDIYVDLVYQVLRMVDACRPHFWMIENPKGRISKLVPELQPYFQGYYEPFHYGDPYSKKTGIWGNCVLPAPTNIVEPVRSGTKESSLDWYWRKVMGAKDFVRRRSYYRSITPEGFSRAFFNVNHEFNIPDEDLDNYWENYVSPLD